MISIFKKIIKAGFNQVGLDVIKQKNNPTQTLLGLRERPIQTVIDIGANAGQFAKQISFLFPQSIIYCFEPLPMAFGALSTWAATQNGRVIPFNLAVGDKEGEVEMFLHADHTPSSSLLATSELAEHYFPLTKEKKRICVKQTTLDIALGKTKSELVSEMLIKIDVQGYEDRVVAGGSEVLSKADVCILEVCLETLYEGQASFIKLHTMLDALGYRYVGNLNQTYGKNGHCIFLDAVFVRQHGN